MVAILVLILSVSVFAQEKTEHALFDGLDDDIAAVMAEWKVPGLAIAVVRDGKVILLKGYGRRDVEADQPVTPDTLFAIGSTTKAFTAMALGLLADEGKLNWDTPVREYLPSFTLEDEYATLHMTPTDLLNHDSGLPRHDLVWYGTSLTREEIFERLRYLEPSAEFRTRYQYNNLMFMTAGYLVGRISGGTWEQFVAERLFKPLGMDRSTFGAPDPDKVDDVASPYELDGEKVKKVPHYKGWAVGPAGSIYSSAREMSNWLQLHLNDGKYGDKQIVTESTMKLLHMPKMVMGGGSREMPITAYGYGWVFQPYRGHHFLWHNGGIDGFYAFIGFLPYDDFGLVILTNRAGNPAPEIISRMLFDRLAGLDEIDWNGRFIERRERAREAEKEASAEGDGNRKEGTSPSHPLADYAGTYAHPAYGEFTVVFDGRMLKGTFRGATADLEHYHYDVFKFKHPKGIEFKFTFALDDDGNVASVSSPLQAGVDAIVFLRVADESLKRVDYLEKFVGEYDLAGQPLTFEIRNGVLYGLIAGQPPYELEPLRENSFRLKALEGYSVEFKVDEGGDVARVVVHQPEGDFIAKRK